MEKLYLDNYRGFNKAFIEFKDVNFLVGENSTGKTSILNIIRFIEDKKIFNYSLDEDFVELGGFEEVATDTNKILYIGYESKVYGEMYYCLIGLKKKKGLISVKSLDFLINHKDRKWENKNTSEYIESIYEINIRIEEDNSVYKTNNKTAKKKHIDFKSRIKKVIKLGSAKFPSDSLYVLKNKNYWNRKLLGIILSRSEKNDNIDPFLPIYDIVGLNSNVGWIDPIRAKPQRIYEPQNMELSFDGQNTPGIIKKVFESTSIINKEIQKKLNSFGVNSGLFKEIKVNRLGSTALAPFEIGISVGSGIHKISNVGYGVSQILPILTELLNSKSEMFLIQQPEVHLHPRAQATLGSFLFHIAMQKNIKLIIETHSDFIIDRYRLELNKNQNIKKQTQILFFEKKNNKNNIFTIEIDQKGNISPKQPESFREFFLNESLSLLEM